tara:strand:+ start:289 stop:684 length:396 start_codon:yes stop_codon:yes gene_type:complete
MRNSNIKLPSNKKFGYFFTLVFVVVGAYFSYLSFWTIGYIMAIFAIVFFIITLFKENLLLPFNKLWMQFGLFLGRLINPIILGILFFGLFTPYAIALKIIKRDALGLKQVKKSYWLTRKSISPQTNFKRQF